MQACVPIQDGTQKIPVPHIAQRPPMPKLMRSRSVQSRPEGIRLNRDGTRITEEEAVDQVEGSENGAENFKPPGTGSLRNTSSRQKAILFALALSDFMSSMALSILAPFFPREAAEKGVSNALSGWIFGVYALVQCFTSPLFGKLLPKTGGKFLSLTGAFFAGGCTVLFGMFEAVGASASTTAGFTIAAQTFPDNPTTVMGLLETSVGLGLMVGPALGGALYEVGGFYLPFVVTGSVMMLTVPFCFFILPKEQRMETSDKPEENASLLAMLKVPAISITAAITVVGSMTWVVLDPTLEPHLRMYNLTPTVVGLVFLLMAACYAVCSPIWGFVADNIYDSSPMMVIGFFFTACGFLLLGPSPMFGISESDGPLWLNIVAITVIGLATSLALVPTYDKILDAGDKAGFQESLANYSAVAGLWNASYSFGEFLGPVLAGWLMGVIGFQWTMTGTSIICFLASFTMLVLYLYERKYGPTGAPKKDANTSSTQTLNVEVEITENTPLLRN